MSRLVAAVSALLLLPLAVSAQAVQDALPETNEALFAPLDLAAPNQYRAADGRPGPAYWQNRNDYDIEATLDPDVNTVTGTVRVSYTNNSPLPLDYVWVHLEQNLFGTASRGARRTPPDSRWRGSFPQGGYRLGTVAASSGPVAVTIDDTRMRLDLARPLAAEGGTVEITVPYSFVVPEYGADRMGRLETERGTVYEIAQWYPRVAVYDDVSRLECAAVPRPGRVLFGVWRFRL